jgi:hypothetical protein
MILYLHQTADITEFWTALWNCSTRTILLWLPMHVYYSDFFSYYVVYGRNCSLKKIQCMKWNMVLRGEMASIWNGCPFKAFLYLADLHFCSTME